MTTWLIAPKDDYEYILIRDKEGRIHDLGSHRGSIYDLLTVISLSLEPWDTVLTPQGRYVVYPIRGVSA